MNRPTTLLQRLARLSILAAALLQFASVAAGPWVHLSQLPAATTVAVDQGGADAAELPGHHELSCVLCHSFAGAALPADGLTIPVPPVLPEPALPAGSLARGVLGGDLPSARSPPHA